jgi:predicted ester cyclase
MSEQNKAAARQVFEVWGSGELSRLDAIVAANVVHHDPNDTNADLGLDGLKATIRAFRKNYLDAGFVVEDQVAEGDRVATRWRSKPLAHKERPGTSHVIAGITIDRFENGLIVEAWRGWDPTPLRPS